MFLNEDCKDAMNIMDFVQSLKYSVAHLDYMGHNGYVEGMTKLIVDGLNELDITQRPIHCTDTKRDTLYLKRADKWEKDTPSMDNIKNVIRNVSKHSLKKIGEWKDANLDIEPPRGSQRDAYLRVMGNSVGGKDEKEDEQYTKSIVHKVALASAIDKNDLKTSI